MSFSHAICFLPQSWHLARRLHANHPLQWPPPIAPKLYDQGLEGPRALQEPRLSMLSSHRWWSCINGVSVSVSVTSSIQIWTEAKTTCITHYHFPVANIAWEISQKRSRNGHTVIFVAFLDCSQSAEKHNCSLEKSTMDQSSKSFCGRLELHHIRTAISRDFHHTLTG